MQAVKSGESLAAMSDAAPDGWMERGHCVWLV